jgi:hypothetical protein
MVEEKKTPEMNQRHGRTPEKKESKERTEKHLAISEGEEGVGGGTVRKLDSDGYIRVNIGWSHPRQTRLHGNRVIPSSDLKSVRGLRL